MITPKFSVDQDEEFVYINIRAPYIKAASIEFFVEDNLFIFSLHPYYLRLRFPANLVDDEERSKTEYDLATGEIKARIAKQNKGETFPDLDMLTMLLAKKGEAKDIKKPMIEELGGEDAASSTGISQAGEDEEINWEIDQELNEQEENLTGAKYGFDDNYTGVVGMSMMNGNDINELQEPEKSTVQERKTEMTQRIEEKFDPDYYLADLHDNDMIQELLAFKFEPVVELTEQDKETMANHLGKRQVLNSNPRRTYISILGILFGILHDQRCTLNEPTVESPWSIGKLAPQMSFLYANFSTVSEQVAFSTQLSLSYPLYRHWNLTIAVWKDVSAVLNAGKRCILHHFLQAFRLFNTGDQYQVYSTIWLHDYCLWIQGADLREKVIVALQTELDKAIREILVPNFRVGAWQIQELADIDIPGENEQEQSMEEPDSDDEDVL